MWPFRFRLGDKICPAVTDLGSWKVKGVIDTLEIDSKGTYASVIWNDQGRRSKENEQNLRLI